MTVKPTTHTLDVINARGVPLRFVLDLVDNVVTYYDRRYPTAEGAEGYAHGQNDENGQNCGPDLSPGAFQSYAVSGIRGWHDVTEWDIDVRTVRVVGGWIAHVTTAVMIGQGG